ncbi:hypothetical protein [Haloarchaeobius sp. DYHT-AS-18]|uniref:hypothetical protein n=1 Tax=Haloarchaeobius sp. DYHT-AS-18 TaxID=3446117 RepID=UPI003EBA9FEF
MAWPHPITIIGLLGGGIAAFGMAALLDEFNSKAPLPSDQFLAQTIGDGNPYDHDVSGVLLYLFYGAFVGALFPTFFHGLLGLEAKYITTVPNTLATGLAFGILLLVPWALLGAAGFVTFPELNLSRDGPIKEHTVVSIVAAHLFYGLILGIITGLSEPVWYVLPNLL